MAYDVIGGFDDFMNNQPKDTFDWVTGLPIYQHLYNTTIHTSLGKFKLFCLYCACVSVYCIA